MDTQTLDGLRTRLENERTRIEGEIGELREGVKATTFLADETDSYDQHMADDADIIFEREKNQALLNNLDHELADIKHALQRMQDGTYGICENCGKPIAEKRLQARPMATTCIECQSKREQQVAQQNPMVSEV